MRHLLYISRTLQPTHGGMQTQAKTFIHSLRERSDVSLSVCGYTGGRALLPFFFLIATVRALFTSTDAVHVGDALMSPMFLLLRLVRPRLQRVATVHGLDLTWRVPGYRWLVGFSLRQAHRVIAVSHATAKVAESLGVLADRISTIPCGVEIPSKSTPSKRSPTLLSIGRLVPRKGHAWFIEHVFASLVKKDATLQYIIAGGGSERSHLERLITSLGLQNRIQLLGDIVEEQKEQLMRESALLIMPNVPTPGTMEGFGIVCVEAASRGLPVIAARLEGLTDAVIEGVTGQFFTPRDGASAQGVIQSALQKQWDALAMHQACLQQFDSNRIASRTLDVIF